MLATRSAKSDADTSRPSCEPARDSGKGLFECPPPALPDPVAPADISSSDSSSCSDSCVEPGANEGSDSEPPQVAQRVAIQQYIHPRLSLWKKHKKFPQAPHLQNLHAHALIPPPTRSHVNPPLSPSARPTLPGSPQRWNSPSRSRTHMTVATHPLRQADHQCICCLPEVGICVSTSSARQYIAFSWQTTVQQQSSHGLLRSCKSAGPAARGTSISVSQSM